MANPRLLIDHPLTAGAEIALTEAQARHVGLVLRLDAGDALRVFNAQDGEWRARVAEKTKRGMRVAIAEKLRAARAAPDLDLLFAPVKRHATDLIVEKATELGAARIRPVITQRTIAETVRTDRLSTIAREAAEQTERFDAPDILEPLPLFKALERWDEARPLIYADESGDEADAAWGGELGRARPLLDVLRALTPSPRGGGGRGRGEPRHFRAGRGAKRFNTAHHPAPQPPPLKGRGSVGPPHRPRRRLHPGGAPRAAGA
ncbi:MAG: RsmE family RNA methyltransferase [Terricaulis sp.]|nr:RsmE family RNA methyltransferase [Terricaulis sp.]